MRTSLPALALALAGCPQTQPGERPGGWYDAGSPYDVLEPIEFTPVAYTFTGPTRIADLPVPPARATLYAADDPPPGTACDNWTTTDQLPAEITGIVTLFPRYYFKSDGCRPDESIDEDERYYGSYFVQDASGGYFVLGDSKVAHLYPGDRVTLRVRALRESYEQTMIAAHDVVSVEHGPEPIWYQPVAVPLDKTHVSIVVRMEGTVVTEPSTFGEVYLDTDDGVRFKIGIDRELSQRGLGWPIGARLQVTGPVLNGYMNEKIILVMLAGQITEL